MMSRILFGLWLFVSMLYPLTAHGLAPGDVVEGNAPVLDSTSATYLTNGPGSISVIWDNVRGRWTGVFEYQHRGADAACPHGQWGLGLAASYDPEGDNGWSVLDGNPNAQGVNALYEPPLDGSYKSCVVAHPAVFWVDAQNTRLGILFKGETDTFSCPLGGDPNTCVYTGIGSGVAQLDAAGNVTVMNVSNSLRVDIGSQFPNMPFGFHNPTYSRATRQYAMLVSIGTDLYITTASNPLGRWSTPTLVMSPGQDSWNQDELFGQEIVCGSNPGELIVFQGGRTYTHLPPSPTSIAEAGFSLMTSMNGGVTWTLDSTPIVQWFDDYDWRHWSVVRVGPDAYRFWFVRKDQATNRLAIWYAEANTNGAVGTPVDKVCP